MKTTGQQNTAHSTSEAGHCRAWKDLLFCAVASSALLAVAPSNLLHAQENPVIDDTPVPLRASPSYRFDIPSLPLMRALEQLSQQAGIPFSVQDGTNLAMNGQAVIGDFSIENALLRMLEGTEVTFAVADGVLVISPKLSNQSLDAEIVTAPISVSANRTPTFQLGTGAASGSTVYGEDMIGAVVQGDSDPNKIFRANPNVQYVIAGQRGEEGATATAEQDLRPQNISISGAGVDQNNFMLDGVGINSFGGTESNYSDSNMPEDDDNTINADTLHGLHPQTVYVDSNILEQAEIIDSNVSAKYGGFQGGVVNYKVKNPSNEPTFGASIKRGGSNWNDYHLKSEETPDAAAKEPIYEKWFYSASASTPINDNWGMLVSAGRRTAETTKTAGDDYYGRQVTTSTEADNVLGKLRYESDTGAAITTQIVYAPYAQEWEASENYDSRMDIIGTGLTTYVGLEKPFEYDGYGVSNLFLDTKLSFNSSENARDSESNVRRQISTTVAGSQYADLCDASTCVTGWYGDLSQTQQDVGYTADLTGDIFGTNFLLGADIHRLSGTRERSADAYYATTRTTGTNVVCASADDIFCDDGDQANRRRTKYQAFEGSVSFVSTALYNEYTLLFDHVPFGELEFRPGARLEHDTYLGNTNLAPRFNATYYTDWDISFNAGWNRYYAANMLSYAFQDATPATISETRTADTTTTPGSSIFYDDWAASSSGIKRSFAGSGLSTPFSDEQTASISFPLPFLRGMTRLKWLERKGRDQFSRSSTDSGSTEYNLSNEGSSHYTSYSAEWSREIGSGPFGGRHVFNVNGQYSERRTSNNSYYVTSDETESVVYNGQIIPSMDLDVLTGNLDEPIFFNISLFSSFDDDRLRTGLTGRYTMDYTTITDSGSNTTIDGTTYDVYEDGEEKARFDLDMTLDYDVIRREKGVLTLNASIENVLNRGGAHTLSSSTPYRKGRTVWLGLTYTY